MSSHGKFAGENDFTSAKGCRNRIESEKEGKIFRSLMKFPIAGATEKDFLISQTILAGCLA